MQKPLYAILLDGGFVTKRLQERLNRPVKADDVVAECDRIQGLPIVAGYELLRIYYYDAHPATMSVKRPVSKTKYDLAATDRFRHSQQLFDQLVLKPNFALRMGNVTLSPNEWKMKHRSVKSLIRGARLVDDNDFELDLSQKGVDIRIGMDMARLALRETVRTVVVVTADTDFVPAFKYVRREGVKVVLDPLGAGGRVELQQHADIVL